MPITQAEMATEKLRAVSGPEGQKRLVDGEWIKFSNKKHYLLPIIARDQKLSPVFHEDGSVEMVTVYPDPELAKLADDFLNIVVNSTNEGAVQMTVQTYSTFIALVRRALLVNYDLSNDELTALLTLSPQDLNALGNSIIQHLARR